MRHRTIVLTVASLFWSVMSGYGHEIQTHKNITRAAVEFAQARDLRFNCSFILDKLQFGTEHEDDHPRYLFHFFPSLDDIYSATCDSPQWGLGTAPICSTLFPPTVNINEHTWDNAIALASDSSGEGWLQLGYILHLLEDLTSPAHTRNDPHPCFQRQLRWGYCDPVEVLTRIPVNPSRQTPLITTLGTPTDFFANLDGWVQSNFFSKDTVRDSSLPGPATIREDDNYFYGSCLDPALGTAPPGFAAWLDHSCVNGERKIAHKSKRYYLASILAAFDPPIFATIDDIVATEQFSELGPVAVLYTASLLKHYADVAGPFLGDCSATSHFDAVTDFSLTNGNPNGPWSYGHIPRSGGTFTVYATGTPNACIAGWDQWDGGGCAVPPFVVHNSSGATINFSSITFPPTLLNVHPTIADNSVVRWTAPTSGNYEVSGHFEGLDTVGTTTRAFIIGVGTLAFDEVVTGFGIQHPFGFTVMLNAGETIDFEVDRDGVCQPPGCGDEQAHDSTGFTAQIIKQ